MDNIRTFRGQVFLDRENEIEYLVEFLNQLPQMLLFIYGPKSSGKTTLIEYIVEEKLLKGRRFWKDSKFWVKYINLRGYLISNYDSFLYAILDIGDKNESEIVKESYEIDVKLIKLKREQMMQIKKQEKDFFNILNEEISLIAKKQKPIIIIDEIQKLEDIYLNGGRESELLKEFLNFCVRLTKEQHLANVVILSSNTIFIDRIYNDAKLKETSKFIKIDHLPIDAIKDWLKIEGFTLTEIDMVVEYFGGAIVRILKLLYEKKILKDRFDLTKYLNQEAFLAYTEIFDYMARGDFSGGEIEIFKDICKEILNNGGFYITEDKKHYLPVISKWAEKEILFYDPLELKVTGNNRLYEKAMEILLKKGGNL